MTETQRNTVRAYASECGFGCEWTPMRGFYLAFGRERHAIGHKYKEALARISAAHFGRRTAE